MPAGQPRHCWHLRRATPRDGRRPPQLAGRRRQVSQDAIVFGLQFACSSRGPETRWADRAPLRAARAPSHRPLTLAGAQLAALVRSTEKRGKRPSRRQLLLHACAKFGRVAAARRNYAATCARPSPDRTGRASTATRQRIAVTDHTALLRCCEAERWERVRRGPPTSATQCRGGRSPQPRADGFDVWRAKHRYAVWHCPLAPPSARIAATSLATHQPVQSVSKRSCAPSFVRGRTWRMTARRAKRRKVKKTEPGLRSTRGATFQRAAAKRSMATVA